MEEVEDMSLDFTSLTILNPGKDDRSLTILNTDIREERDSLKQKMSSLKNVLQLLKNQV